MSALLSSGVNAAEAQRERAGIRSVRPHREAVRNARVQCNVNSNGSLAKLKDQLVNFVLCG